MAREKSIQMQIMEAGFADMLRDHGFQKVSGTHYRREDDFLTWHTCMRRGFAKELGPRSFRDATGYHWPALDPIEEAYRAETGDQAWKHRIMATTIDVHHSFSISSVTPVSAIKNLPPPPPKPKSWLDRLLGPGPPKPDTRKFRDTHPDMAVTKTEEAWWLRDREVDEFLPRLMGYWETHILATIRDFNDPKWHCANQLEHVPKAPSFVPSSAAKLWLLGNREFIEEQYSEFERRGSLSREQVVEALRSEGRFDEGVLMVSSRTPQQIIDQRISATTKNIARSKALREILINQS